MAIKLVIADAGLSPSLCADFRNVGRPVQSGCYPYTKIFIEVHSLLTAVVDNKGGVRYDGLFLSRYNHVFAFGSVKFHVITIGPSTKIVDITLQIIIVSRCVNWTIKQDVICIKRHSSIGQGDHGDIIDINDEQQWPKNRTLRNSRVNRQDVRQMRNCLRKHTDV